MPLGFPASNCCHVGSLSLTACALLESHLPSSSPRQVPPARKDNRKGYTKSSGHLAKWDVGMLGTSLLLHSSSLSTSSHKGAGKARLEEQLGCGETNPERYHSEVSQCPTPVPKRHQRGSAALRTLCPTRVVLPRAGGFSRGQEWARLCREVLPLRLLPRDSQTQEKRNEGWADRQTSARHGQGRRGRPRHSRQRPGDTRQSHGDTPRFQGTPPLGPPAPVPFLPAQRLRGRECCPCPNPSGAGSRSPVRV